MTDSADFFSGVQQKQIDVCPEGMSVTEWKRLKEKQETERYLNRGNSYVVSEPIEDHSELDDLFRRGDLVKASELEAKLKAEEEAQKAFEAAAEIG